MDFSTSNLKASNSYDEQLLSRVIHYHGFQLTVALQKSLDVDLGPFIREQILMKGKQKSVRGITGVEVSKSIQEFIANNAKVLYETFPKRNQMQTDYVSPLPNLEMYVNKCPESRRRSFLKRVEEGDVVYGVITSKSGRHQLEVHVLCSEGKKYTNVSMLNVLGTVVVPEYAQSREPLYIDDLVRCGVHSKVKTTKPRICFYLAVENFQFANRLKKPTSPLGKIKFEELPPKFRASHTMDGSENLHEVVENYVNSPDCEASLIARKFGVEDKPLSLMPSLRQQPPAIGSALSQLQMDCWSSQVVKDGKNLVNKNPKIAMDCFDMALKFNPLNSEATYLKKMLSERLRKGLQSKETQPSENTNRRGNKNDIGRNAESRWRFENRRGGSHDSTGWFHEENTKRRDNVEDRRDRFQKRSTERKDSFRERSPDRRVNSRERRDRLQRSPDGRANLRGRRENYQRRSPEDRESAVDERRLIRSGDFRDNFRNRDRDRRGVYDNRNHASGRNYSRNSDGRNYSRRDDDSGIADDRETWFVDENAEDNWIEGVGQRSLDVLQYDYEGAYE